MFPLGFFVIYRVHLVSLTRSDVVKRWRYSSAMGVDVSFLANVQLCVLQVLRVPGSSKLLLIESCETPNLSGKMK